MQASSLKIGNGSLSLPAAWGREFTVWGGPFRRVPTYIGGEPVVSLKLAPEVQMPCSMALPIVDYSVPTDLQVDGMLPEILRQIVEGKPVYMGCMGGMGRTGLILAIVAKAWGIPDPVKYVRENYYSHAVETPEQYSFVTLYEVQDDARKIVSRAKFWSFFGWSQHLTPAAGKLASA